MRPHCTVKCYISLKYKTAQQNAQDKSVYLPNFAMCCQMFIHLLKQRICSSYYLSLTHKTTYTPSSTWCKRFSALRWKCESVDILIFRLFVILSLQTSWFQFQCTNVFVFYHSIYTEIACIYITGDTMVTGRPHAKVLPLPIQIESSVGFQML